MFDYDRLSLNVAQQFSTAPTAAHRHRTGAANGAAKTTTTLGGAGFGNSDGALSNGSSESQLFGWDSSPSPPSAVGSARRGNDYGMGGESDGEENSIVHGLSELLRRRSSPMGDGVYNGGGGEGEKNYFVREQRMSAGAIDSEVGQHLQRHRSATIGSGDQVCAGILPAHRQAALLHQQRRAIANALSADLAVGGGGGRCCGGGGVAIGEQTAAALNRRFSNDSELGGGGGCCLSSSEMLFDCGASSGYGSPGHTPLASPSAGGVATTCAASNSSTVQYIANQLQKLFFDRASSGSCEEAVRAADDILRYHHQNCCQSAHNQQQNQNRQQRKLFLTTGGNNGKNLVGRVAAANALAAAVAAPESAPVLVKATTTTTGTNKNSNKRKTSSVGGGGGAGGGQCGRMSPGPENIVATEDGFCAGEIAEFAQLLNSPKRMPPPRYICHICYQPGHYIGDCPQRFNSPYEELTPYQGRKKCYGEFQCEQCKRKWTSQNSVANEAQSCIKCHVPVFPHKQLPVDKAIALGLVKLQRLPVNGVLETPPTPSSPSTPLSPSHDVLTAMLSAN